MNLIRAILSFLRGVDAAGAAGSAPVEKSNTGMWESPVRTEIRNSLRGRWARLDGGF